MSKIGDKRMVLPGIKMILCRPGVAMIILLAAFLLMSENLLSQPSPPVVGPITQPTCAVATGSVVLNGLPKKVLWTLKGTPGDIVIVGLGTSYTVTGLAPETYTFTVTVRDETSEPSDKVVINKQPIPPDEPKAEVTQQPTCLIPTGTILVNYPEEGTGYEYSIGGSYQESSRFTDLNPGDYKVTVRRKEDITCVSPPVILTVNEQPVPPPAPTGPSPQNFCSIPAPVVSLLNAMGSGIKWYLNATGGTALPPSTLLSARNYYASQTVGDCESTTRLEVTVIIVSAPVVNAGSDGEECDLDFELNALLVPGTGTWTKISGPGNAEFTPDNHQPDALVTVNQYGTYTFSWTVVHGPCSSSDNVSVVFNTLPAVNAGKDTAVCRDSSVQLHAQGDGTFIWTPAGLLNDPDIPDPVATPLHTTLFTVTLTDANGCVNTDDVIVEVRDQPVADAGLDLVLDYTSKTNMTAKVPGVHETGSWSVIQGTGTFADQTNARTAVSDLSLGLNKFLWTVTNNVCPPSNSIVKIFINDLVIPTLITPNGDPNNEYFILKGIRTLGKTELIIIDRHGKQVYKNSNYNNEWNGIDYNGNPLPDDTYFFVLRSENGRSASGYIVVRR